MAFVIVMWLVGAAVFLTQGFYIIRTGQSVWFFMKRDHTCPSVGPMQRLGHALVYLLPSIGMILILGGAFNRTGFGPLKHWFGENSAMLFWTLFLAVGGAMYLVQPVRMLRWTVRNNPQLAENRVVVIEVRLLGLGILLIALFMLSKM